VRTEHAKRIAVTAFDDGLNLGGIRWSRHDRYYGKMADGFAELHLHLEGSIEPETLQEIDPSLTREEIAANTAYRDFAGFIQSYIWVNRKLRSPEDYAIAARRLFEKLARENVGYAEVTLSAGMMLWKSQDFAAIFEAVQREAWLAPIRVRWILDAVRQFGAGAAAPVLELAIERARDGVVAFGLGGFEAANPAHEFEELYQRARDWGLHTVCHAGETTNAQNVWDALAIGSERIGHGIRAVESPKLVEYLREKKIPLEICISSNVRTGSVESIQDHPVRRLFDAGVEIVLNTDDPALFECSLAGEYEIARKCFGFSAEELETLRGNAFRYAFGGE
jgi:aminodeoxyfutalosine deaminase